LIRDFSRQPNQIPTTDLWRVSSGIEVCCTLGSLLEFGNDDCMRIVNSFDPLPECRYAKCFSIEIATGDFRKIRQPPQFLATRW